MVLDSVLCFCFFSESAVVLIGEEDLHKEAATLSDERFLPRQSPGTSADKHRVTKKRQEGLYDETH